MLTLPEQIGLLIKARYPLLYLLTHEEDRAERMLRRLCKQEELQFWRWRRTEGLISDEESGDTTQAREASMGPVEALRRLHRIEMPGIFMFSDFHAFFDDPMVVRSLRDVEPVVGGRRQVLVLVGPSLRIPHALEKDLRVLDLPLPNAEEVGLLLRVLLQSHQIEIPADRFERFVRASLGLTEREVKRAYAQVMLQEGRFEEADLKTLGSIKRQAIRRSRFLEYYDEVEQLAGVGGMSNLKGWLERRARAFGDEARRFGLPTPKGLFLLGVQGCGKSLTAKAVAGLFQMPLLRLDVGELFQGQGRQEESLRETIRIAESVSPVVLWIDELEKAFMIGQGQTGGGLGTLLTWMQEKTQPVFVVATANDVRSLPPELLRKGRFDEVFFIDLPDIHERLEVLEIHMRRRGRDPERFELLQVAEETEKYSGAELEQVIVEALFNAFSEGRDLQDRDLLRVVRDTVPLAVTMDDHLKQLREWARPRTRPASHDRRRVDFFDEFEVV